MADGKEDGGNGIQLLALLMIVLIVVGVVGYIWWSRQDRSGLNPELPPVSTGSVTPPADGGAARPTQPGDPSQRPSGNGNSYGSSPLQGSDLERAQQAAINFATAFYGTSYNSDQEMVASVGRYTTPSLKARLANVDHAKIPSYTVTNRAGPFSRGTNDALIDVVLTDGGAVRTTRAYVVRSGGDWLVDDYGMRGGVS